MVKKNAGKIKEKGKKKSKKGAKKEGPKKPLSGFMFFSQERRKTLKDEKPDLKITEASVVIGAEWKKLTNSEKEPYQNMAKDDKKRYEQEKEKFESAEEKKQEAADSEEEEKKSEESEEEDSDD